MKKVVILTIAEGHVSIAKAIAQKLAVAYETTVVPYRIAEFDLYLPIYQLFPGLFQVPYKLSHYQQACEFARTMIKRKYQKKIEALISEQHPDILISTYFLYDHLCAAYGKKYEIPTFNVITNPRTIHPIEASTETTTNITFDNQASHILTDYGVTPEHILSVGWFVREQFKPTTEKMRVRATLRLTPHLPTFLFTAGSDGTSTILKVLPLFFQVTTPLQVVFICGNNTSLYKSLRLFVKTFQFTHRNSSLRFVILRYVENIHEYMQAADLVIGKAGPNSLFESIACHTPFFALTHITGQEDGNLEIIQESKLGFVEENPMKAIKLLSQLARNPDQLRSLRPSIEKMAHSNQQSGGKLLSLLQGM